MAKNEELVRISSSAFLNLLLHVFRFWSIKDVNKREVACGLLIGIIEGDTRYVKKISPLLHQPKKDIKMDEEFMRMVGRKNKEELDNNSMNEVIGWYRSSQEGIKFTARDIKNHIQFQEHNSRFIGLVLDPQGYLHPEESGFSIFRLEGEKYYNMMTDFYRIPWEIEEIEDAHEIISAFKTYIKNYFLNEPLIKEINE